MATLAEFLARVLPWPAPGEPGVLNVHWTIPDRKGMGGKPFVNLADMVSFIPWANNRPTFIKDIYFCLSRQGKTGPLVAGKAKALRETSNATHVKAIWLDLDGNKPGKPDKGYPTKAAALDAFFKFLAASNMPPPSAIVDSGGGYHVYWISDRPLTVDEWAPFAAGLWALVQKHGLICDPVTQDVVRVLRPPETLNHKTTPAKDVVLKLLANDYDFGLTLGWIVQHGLTIPAVSKPLPSSNMAPHLYNASQFPAQPPLTDPEDSLSCGIETLPENKPLDWAPVTAECPFFKDTMATAGAHNNEPLWHLVLLAASFGDDPEKLAHSLSSGYPSYTAAETDEKLAQKVTQREIRGLGWPACAAFERAGAKQCSTCVHKGKVRSPLNLTHPVAPPITQNTSLLSVLPNTRVNNDLPEGYFIDPDPKHEPYIGFIYEKPIGGGQTAPVFSNIFSSVLTDAWAEKDPDALHFLMKLDKGHTRGITVPQGSFASTTAIRKTLSDAGVLYNTTHVEKLVSFMTSFMEKLRLAQEARTTVPYGWFIDGEPHGFAYGGKLFKDDGTELQCSTGDPKMRQRYTPRGTLDPWFVALDMVLKQRRPGLEILTLASFAAPLMRLTGHSNGVLTVYGTSCGNKSSAIMTGLALWGNPTRTKQVPDASKNSIIKTLGETQSLPVCWDDLRPEQFDKVVSVVHEATQGAGPGRLNTDRSSKDTGSWESLLVITANQSISEALVKKQKNDAATLYRVFEYVVNKLEDETGRPPTFEAAPIYKALDENYGQMGLMFAKRLGTRPKATEMLVNKTSHLVNSYVHCRGDERYWLAICAVTVAAALMANEILREIRPDGFMFDEDGILRHMINTYREMRTKMVGANLDSASYEYVEGALTKWLKHCGGNTIWTKQMPAQGRSSPMDVLHGPDLDRGAHRPIHMQWVVDRQLCRISREAFSDYMMELEYSPDAVMKGLKAHYGMKFTPRTVNLCATTKYNNGAREILMLLPVPFGSPLEGGLYAYTPLDQRPKSPAETTHSGLLTDAGVLSSIAQELSTRTDDLPE